MYAGDGDDLVHKLQGGKIFYVGGFYNGRPHTPQSTDSNNGGSRDEYGYEAVPSRPFVTPGSFKLVVKGH